MCQSRRVRTTGCLMPTGEWCVIRALLCLLTTATMSLAGRAAGQETSPDLAFHADGKGGYSFDTGILRGTLRQEGKARGLSPVVHIPSGARLDGSMGILSHYRVFTANKRYGTAAWDWPGTAKPLPDGTVQVTWPETPDRPFEMGALYRWKDPQTLDVETTVTAREDLGGFETFLASYFTEEFPAPRIYAENSPEAEGKSAFIGARQAYGDWQMFLRDMRLIPLIRDGRWMIEPHPVDWKIMRRLAAPVCLRRHTAGNLAVILMAPPQDCFAIATPYDGEAHYSLYLSLFGRDIKAGASATAHTRFIVATGASDEEVLTLYRQYMSELAAPTDAGQGK